MKHSIMSRFGDIFPYISLSRNLLHYYYSGAHKMYYITLVSSDEEEDKPEFRKEEFEMFLDWLDKKSEIKEGVLE